MNKKRIQLAVRRAELIHKAARQREILTVAFSPIRVTLTYADKSMHILRYVAQHPAILAGTLALAVAVKPKRWFFWLETGWMAWGIARAAKRKLDSKDTLRLGNRISNDQ